MPRSVAWRILERSGAYCTIFILPWREALLVRTDLVSDVAASLANDPSAANFKICLEKMFDKLKDPLTHIAIDKNAFVKLLTNNDSLPTYRLLDDSVLYVAFPTSFGSRDSIRRINWLEPKQLEKYKALVLDLRNEIEVYDDDYYFMRNFGDSLLKNIISGPLQMTPYIYRYQSGFIDQSYGLIGANIYNAGWQTTASDPFMPAKKNSPWKGGIIGGGQQIHLRTIDEIFAGTEGQPVIVKLFLTEISLIITTDAAIDYYTTADSLHLKIRVFDYVDMNGKITRDPDLFINGIQDEKTFLEKCRMLALAPKETTTATTNVSLLDYIHPFPHDANIAFASAGQRLFGLYNYWNAINYFNPNKHLLKQSWDSVLTEFIPRFINANDTASYYFTITDLVSHIHDSHGFFGKLPDMKTVTRKLQLYCSFICKANTRKVLHSFRKDSTLNAFQPWDEIVAIDSIPVNTYKQMFRSRFAYSNDRTFERDLCSYFLLSGKKNSLARLTIRRNGKTMQLNATRTVLGYKADYKQVSFNDDHKDIELLKGNIGYVNMGSLSGNRIDKMFDTLMQTKAIIFDIRNYPQGTAWGIVPRLTDHDSVAVKFGKPYVTYESISSPLIFSMSEYFIVNADKKNPGIKARS